MSWNIYIYAEYKTSKDNSWHELVKTPVFDDFKNYKDDFYESLQVMSSNESSHSEVKDIKNGFTDSNVLVKHCLLSEFRHHYYSVIEMFNSKLKSVFTALDIDLNTDDDYYIYDCADSEYEEDSCNKKYGIEMYLSKMTTPINKKLMNDFIYSLSDFSKAQQMLGLCSVLESMVDYDSQVRLLFVVM